MGNDDSLVYIGTNGPEWPAVENEVRVFGTKWCASSAEIETSPSSFPKFHVSFRVAKALFAYATPLIFVTSNCTASCWLGTKRIHNHSIMENRLTNFVTFSKRPVNIQNDIFLQNSNFSYLFIARFIYLLNFILADEIALLHIFLFAKKS